ncbi:helix-turn-helix transcriptional regulator [Sulfitobacter sp. G21635-S1]|uniref:S24 family peptidase n=1 Tax=Sulfitobacter sp. G21635-S1 TaxID=3014043 RepID=UPI0022AEB9AA|nr:S24 family peptidase [Sulfitobacter sp. G21635-S1]MCZ4258650.1 helix-turn-helix transcriptional regulator [Sulfitobacter sp. G21635-S1]
MPDRIDFQKIVRNRLSELDEKVYAIEKKHGLPADALRNVGRGDKHSGPRLARVEEICNALGLELYIGPPRAPISNHQKIGADFARIPRYEAQLAAGHGAHNGDNIPTSSLAFRLDWLSRIGVNPKHCCLVNVMGDSMEPTLYNGDLVMIDQQVRRFRSNRLFAFVNADGDAQVKRVTVHSQALALISDNRNYEPQLLTMDDADRLTIIGQVVWSGHDFER